MTNRSSYPWGGVMGAIVPTLDYSRVINLDSVTILWLVRFDD